MFKKFLQRLKFKAMARQLRKPAGVMGKKTGLMMNKANAFLYDYAIKEMKLPDGEKVLEIGFGNGLFFEKILEQVHSISVYGIDYSDLMVKEARNNNAKAIADGKLHLVSGNSDAMPWSNDSFDKIFCINVVYFWDDIQNHLREIKRVLKPGGRFYAIFRTKESMQLMPFTAYGFTPYTTAEWATQLEMAGLAATDITVFNEPAVEFEGKPFQVQSICAAATKND